MISYIRFENVSKVFKQEKAINNISFEIEKGKIYGFVGRNGCGKTLIFKLLIGLLNPTSGNIYFGEKNLTKKKYFINSLGALIENPGFIPHYSGYKNLSILNDLSDKRVCKTRIIECMELVGLDAKNKKHVKAYSLGMTQKLGIAQAILNSPELLILDEPMNGLDEASVVDMRKLLLELKKTGTTILLASHNQEDIDILCDEMFFLKSGVIVDKKESKVS